MTKWGEQRIKGIKMFFENIYNAAPIWVQNILCSLYGLKLYNERYSAPWNEYYSSLLSSEFIQHDELANMQKKRFVKVLLSAKENTDYYSTTLSGLTLKDDYSLEEIISMVPILEKETFRTAPNAFLSRKYDKKKLVKINTSGTTGTPMSIYLTPEARKMNYAFFSRSKKWAGINGFERSATFAGRLIVPQKQKYQPFWRSNIFFRNTLFSSYHISEANIPFYVDALARVQPIFIDTYPSSIYPIALYILKQGITDVRPRAIITSSETLLEHQREVIEKAFNCKIYDQYGSAEQVVFACQCKYGSYHLNTEFGYLEVVDSNNNPVQVGELGEFVCTGFTNDAMPLIRYKIGDMGILSKNKCECGRNLPVIEKVIGRIDDILVTPEGKYIGRLDPIFKGMKNTIKETQIVQQAPDYVNVIIVRSEGYREKDGNSIVSELRKRMGNGVTIKIKYVDKISRTSSGKFRSVVNNISSS